MCVTDRYRLTFPTPFLITLRDPTYLTDTAPLGRSLSRYTAYDLIISYIVFWKRH